MVPAGRPIAVPQAPFSTDMRTTENTSAPAAANTDAPAPIGFATSLLFAIACGALAANLYYVQPLVALIGGEVGLSPSAESLLFTTAQLGYAVGLLFLVPLGDLVENRKLILAVMALNVASLIGLVFAPGLSMLFAMILLVGVTASAAQVIVPLAASLAPAARRGQVVGNVMTGLFVGILLARPVSSFLADHFGWRGVFVLSAGVIAGLAAWGAFAIPRRVPQGRHAYLRLIGSLAGLMITQPVLRRRAAYPDGDVLRLHGVLDRLADRPLARRLLAEPDRAVRAGRGLRRLRGPGCRTARRPRLCAAGHHRLAQSRACSPSRSHGSATRITGC